MHEEIFHLVCVIFISSLFQCHYAIPSTESNICEYEKGQEIYCNCDSFGVDEAKQVECWALQTNGLTVDSAVWDRFTGQRSIVSLIWMAMNQSIKLEFFPLKALKYASDSIERFSADDSLNIEVLKEYSLSNITSLAKVFLKHNNIKQLNKFSFAHLPLLETLDLTDNMIQSIHANVFFNLPRLKELFLDRNQIAFIDDYAFIHLNELNELDLRLNQITTITPYTFAGLKKLKNLDLSRNLISEIPNYAFSRTPLLRELDFNGNQIKIIHDYAFHNSSHLGTLQLNNNSIKSLPNIVFKGNPLLVLIDLSQNKLETIDYDVINQIDNLYKEQFVFYLEDNNLTCNCHLLWLNDLYSKSQSTFLKENLKKLKCTVKHELIHLKVTQVHHVIELGYIKQFSDGCKDINNNKVKVISGQENRITTDSFGSDKPINNQSIIDDNHIQQENREQNYIKTPKTHRPSTSIKSNIKDDVGNNINEINDSPIRDGAFNVHQLNSFLIICTTTFMYIINF